MRIVIDIDGDQIRVQRVAGDEPAPPAAVLARAAALGAESAGYARLPGGLTAAVNVGAEPTDAGRAPAPRRAAARRPARRAAPKTKTARKR
jgi:hypothetical protein